MIYVIASSQRLYTHFMSEHFRHVNPFATRLFTYVGPNDVERLYGIERGSCYFYIDTTSIDVREMIERQEMTRIEVVK